MHERHGGVHAVHLLQHAVEVGQGRLVAQVGEARRPDGGEELGVRAGLDLGVAGEEEYGGEYRAGDLGAGTLGQMCLRGGKRVCAYRVGARFINVERRMVLA